MMKKPFLFAVCVAGLFAACASSTTVSRVGADTRIDLSGRWNDTDTRQVAEALINKCLSSPALAGFIAAYAASHNGALPTCQVGTFRNDTNDHNVRTEIIAKTMEIAIVNSGKLKFVAGGKTREELRAEKFDQMENASEKTAAAIGNETGAALLLTGSIGYNEDREGNKTVRSYFSSAEMTNIETNERVWMDEYNEIKKYIERPRVRW